MSYVISFLGGKGGITKTTLARAVAVKFRLEDWLVGGLDIDTAQASFRRWNMRRQNSGITPELPVYAGTVGDIATMKQAEEFHLIIADGAAYASMDSYIVAEASDLIVVSCRFSIDDMESAVETMNGLVKRGVPVDRFCVVFSGVPEQRSTVNHDNAKAYMAQTPYFVADGYIEQMNSITDAQNVGYAMNEVRYASVQKKIDVVLSSIVDRLEQVTQ
ncbi:ParA family protein [Salmonella enterica]|nr:ParA family protein [Salmonella enterica]